MGDLKLGFSVSVEKIGEANISRGGSCCEQNSNGSLGLSGTERSI